MIGDRDDLSDMKDEVMWTALDVINPTCMSSEDPNLDELKKFWLPVIEEPTNFSFWENLLQYVDQRVDDVEEAREAYFAFLQRFPFHQYYWLKFATYELMRDKENCDVVFDLGFVNLRLSVDFWADFINYCFECYEDENSIRGLFDMMVGTCGIHFRSDPLWEMFIEWEMERGHTSRVIQIYDQLLETPTEKHATHWHNFQEMINTGQLPLEEFFQDLDDCGDFVGEILQKLPSEVKEGPFPILDSVIQTETCKKLIEIRQVLYAQTEIEVTRRWLFEKEIKRPYFMEKPLDQEELQIWMNYLKDEIEKCDQLRIGALFERGLIACSHHEDYWLFYSKYLEDEMRQCQGDGHAEQKAALEVRLRRIYRRGCTTHVPSSTSLLQLWCKFEEWTEHFQGAHLVLDLMEKVAPEFEDLALLRINLYRRQEDYDKVLECYSKCIDATVKDNGKLAPLVLRASRFASRVMCNESLAEDFMDRAIEKEPRNVQLYLQLFDLHFQKMPLANPVGCVKALNRAMQSPLDVEDRCQFAKRKVEFIEEFGSSADDVSQAQKEYTKLVLEMLAVTDTKNRIIQLAQEEEVSTKKIVESTKDSLCKDIKIVGAGAAASGSSYSNKAANYEGFQGYNNPGYQYQATNGWVGQQGYYHFRYPNLHQYNYPRIQYLTAGGPGNQGYYYHQQQNPQQHNYPAYHQYPAASGEWVNQQGFSYQQQQNPQQYYYPSNHQ